MLAALWGGAAEKMLFYGGTGLAARSPPLTARPAHAAAGWRQRLRGGRAAEGRSLLAGGRAVRIPVNSRVLRERKGVRGTRRDGTDSVAL